ncbi:MAG: hypothetical protein R3D98_14235 [Candidatus Krumholzibacteriia bacterium]
MLDAPLPVSELLEERLFRTRIELPPRWAAYYDRLIETPVLGRNRRHELTYAYSRPGPREPRVVLLQPSTICEAELECKLMGGLDRLG